VSTGEQLPRFQDIVHIHGQAVTNLRLPDPEDTGTIILRNAGNFFYQSILRNVSKHLNLPSLRLLKNLICKITVIREWENYPIAVGYVTPSSHNLVTTLLV
jgi:hypothetical protein